MQPGTFHRGQDLTQLLVVGNPGPAPWLPAPPRALSLRLLRQHPSLFRVTTKGREGRHTYRVLGRGSSE